VSTPFSDYILFADESGAPTLEGPDPQYPVFVLTLVMVRKDVYVSTIVPRLQRLKFDLFGHDQIIFHERDIRKQTGPFSVLRTDPKLRAHFLEELTRLIEIADVEVIAAVIRKDQLRDRYRDPWSPYDIAAQFCLERLHGRLTSLDQVGRRVHLVFESRGHEEDRRLSSDLAAIVSNRGGLTARRLDFSHFEWEFCFADKRSNSAGLQFADLFARPIGLSVLRPDQGNRAFKALREKFAADGLKIFP
jgi:hypothetical protein